METATAAQGQQMPSSLQVEAPVTSVTLFEDRALVVRRAQVELPEGSHRLIIAGVTPLAVDRSLRVVPAEGAVRTGDSRVTRRLTLERQGSAELPGLEAEEKALKAQEAALAHNLESMQRQLELLQTFMADVSHRWGASVPRGIHPRSLEPVVAQGFARQGQLQEQQRLTQLELADVRSRLSLIPARKQLAAMSTGAYVAQIEARAEVEQAGSCVLEVRYTVPCAVWRPEHKARLTQLGDVRRLSFATQAVVWQSTGESWDNVTLTCSTARPGRVASAPLLEDDVIYSRRKAEQERKVIQAEVREQEVQTTGLEGGADAGGMPGVDDGGEALSWQVEGLVSVPSSGRPLRLPLFEWEAGAEVKQVAFAEKAAQVLLRCEAVNPGPRPVLAGPVVLFQESGYVGRTQVGFVARGERFALSFGSLDALRVYREQTVKRDTTRLTGYQTVQVTVTLSLSNLSDESAEVELTERLLVSEIEEVRVTLGDAAPARSDENGMLIWTEKLKPRGHLSKAYTYTVEAPARVNLPF